MLCALGVGYLRPFRWEGIQLLFVAKSYVLQQGILHFSARDATSCSEGCCVLQHR
jgi:hypothetical protein